MNGGDTNGNGTDPLACWVESKPCKCGAKNWTTIRVERVAVQLGAKNGELALPVEGGAPVRRRSINLWRPIAGLFAVNLREENVDAGPISPGPESDPYDQGPHEAIQVLYCCNKCKSEFYCTYEMISEEKGKTQSFGKYANSCQCQSKMGASQDRICEEEHGYEMIQRIYADMWDRDKFSRHFNNCKHWSDMFWWKVHPQEYKRKKAEEEHMGGQALKI